MIRSAANLRRRAVGGFTLIEVMLALSLVVLLAWGMFSVMTGLSARRDRLVQLAARQEQTGTFFDLVERDLLCSVAAGSSGEAGVAGTASDLRISARGMSQDVGGRQTAGAGLYTASYRFDAAAGQVLLSRNDAGGAGSGEEVVIEGVRRIGLRYYNGSEWVTEYDSVQAGGLPALIEVSVWFGEASSSASAATSGSGAAMDGPAEGLPDRVRQIAVPDAGREAAEDEP